MKHLITPDEIRELGRPIGQVEDEQIEAYIDETEQLYVKPMLGDKLYIDLLAYIDNLEEIDPDTDDVVDEPETDESEEGIEALDDNEEEEAPDHFGTLLKGGLYQDDDENDYYFSGLRMAMSYYVYAQNIMSGDFQSTRYGMVIKDNDYSHSLTGKERSDAYNNALSVANRYMGECVAFCKTMKLIETGKKRKATGSIRIRKIG